MTKPNSNKELSEWAATQAKEWKRCIDGLFSLHKPIPRRLRRTKMKKPHTNRRWSQWAATEVMGWKKGVLSLPLDDDQWWNPKIKRWVVFSPYTRIEHAMECVDALKDVRYRNGPITTPKFFALEYWGASEENKRWKVWMSGPIPSNTGGRCQGFGSTPSQAIMHAIFEVKKGLLQ